MEEAVRGDVYSVRGAPLDTILSLSMHSHVPRYRGQSSLPALHKIFPDFSGLTNSQPKVKQVAHLLRPVALAHRTTHNLTFYSTRDIAEFFGISQNTAMRAIQALESDGLLKRMRGSNTLLLGRKVIARTRVRAVVGLMSWMFAERFSQSQQDLSRLLAEQLRPHHIAMEIIPHYDLGDERPDLNESLKRHALDFTIWLFPFAHHKDHLLHLQDRGIRNLVIGVEGIRSVFEPQILVDYLSSYKQLLNYWRDEHGINRVLVIQPREFTPRKRIELFAQTAVAMGFDCVVEPNTYTLPAELLARESQRVGIALLDEHSSAEFTFYDPPAFVELLRRHRILFGNGPINVPFVLGEPMVDRIIVPIESMNPKPAFLIPLIVKTMVQWSSGNFAAPAQTIPTKLWTNDRLWRYL